MDETGNFPHYIPKNCAFCALMKHYSVSNIDKTFVVSMGHKYLVNYEHRYRVITCFFNDSGNAVVSCVG